jgi:hypothetical protein
LCQLIDSTFVAFDFLAIGYTLLLQPGIVLEQLVNVLTS